MPIKNSSFELLSKANKISKETSSALHAFIAHGSNDAWTAKLGEYGVGRKFIILQAQEKITILKRIQMHWKL
jgi:hypothetical protein